jgi:hypothetical protein
MSTLVLDGTSPRSRTTDPVTSVDSGRAADLNASQREVLAMFVSGSAMADHQLVALAESNGTIFTPQRLRSARAELTEFGLLDQYAPHGEPLFRYTERGRLAHVWALAKLGRADA